MGRDTVKSISIAYGKPVIVSLDEIHEFQGDLKELSEDSYKKLATEIETTGFAFSPHVWLNKGKYYLIDGHQRCKTLKRLCEEKKIKAPKISVIPVEAKNKKEAKMRVLQAASQYGRVTDEGLKKFVIDAKIELSDLERFDFPTIDLPDFEKELRGESKGLIDDDEIPEVKESICKFGQIWQLGNHRLMCGDSTDKVQVEKLMNGEKADITFTSPPYNLGKSIGMRNGSFKGKSTAYKNHNDEMQSSDYLELLQLSTSNALLVSDYQVVNIQWLAGNKKESIEWLNHFKAHFVDVLIWEKTNPPPAMADQVATSGFEFLFIFSSEINPKRTIKTATFMRGSFNNVFRSSVGSNSHTEGTHGATFPVSFAEHYISNLSKQSVIDLFGGSGSTLIACEKTNRKCFMMDIDPHYCDVIVARWECYTGKKALLVDDLPKTKIRKKSLDSTTIPA